MALPYKSIAIESGIEFINLRPTDISPFVKECDIKVFYLGKNDNESDIEKDVAENMARSLRGNPIVGYFKESEDDFADHGKAIIIDDEGLHFKKNTKPYGFVAPDAKVWFQDFEEQNRKGDTVIRTYLCTTGYVWIGKYFEEANKIFEENGKPQSMELDPESIQGEWTKDIQDDVEFFIISDAVFSALCILGDKHEPCFEGASITEVKDKTDYVSDKEFKQSLFTMMKQFQDYTLKGESRMSEVKENTTPVAETEEKEVTENFSATQDISDKSSSIENNNTVEDTTSTEFKKDDKEEKKETAPEEEEKTDDTSKEEDDEKEDDDKKKKSNYSLEESYKALEQNLAKMQQDYDLLKSNYEALVQFKNSIEDQKKDELIAKFYMLSDEDKKDVIENKSNYSYNEIEEKLAVIGFKKGVDFSKLPEQEQDDKVKNATTTFDLNGINAETSTLPDWVQAVKETEKQF